ncbi:MAG: choice-of-anchor J domain-containing protein [Bacteroidia bacterium]|nr:choice-of-anchor J domain-containing protein [Bacteroidia bacterium]
MKKLFERSLMLAALFLGIALNANAVEVYPYSCGFENETEWTSDWLPIVYAGNVTWQRTSNGNGMYSHGGQYFAYSATTYGDSRIEVVSPAFNLTAGNSYELSFWTATTYVDDFRESKVRIREDYVTPGDESNAVVIWEEEEPQEEWRQIFIDLTPWAGKTVYISFLREGYDAHGFCVDDFKIEETAGSSFEITANAAPFFGGNVEGAGTYDNGEAATLTATGRNGYVFSQWSDGNTENPRQVTVTQSAEFTAEFVDAYEYPEVYEVNDNQTFEEGFETEDGFGAWRGVNFTDFPNCVWTREENDGEIIMSHSGDYLLFGDALLNAYEEKAFISRPLKLNDIAFESRMTFYSMVIFAEDYVHHSVRVSTNPDIEALYNGEWDEAWVDAEPIDMEYVKIEIDLSEYIGETVYIAFYKKGDNGPGWCIDDVKVTAFKPETVNENNAVSLNIFPNPANDFVNVIGENLDNLEVYNAVGQLVMNVNLANENKIDIANLESGVYFFSVIDKNGNKVVKKVVRK